ncbi:RHS repeat-associated core domain-containing protein [Methylobacterium indicum]|uniref:RHS repeat-associated core domain-containing protein n=1 Tax=Methylobacterium indicum TaxID=1775910 RepID=UPI00244EE146|nr:RHS repeat-associated core domain-containing protein [Methylobacterium indicum]
MSLAGVRAARDEADGDEADLCPIGFPGQWADNENGLSYNRFRYYDAEAGQYASPDPIGLAGGERPQAYVDGAVVWIDPYGLASACPSPRNQTGIASGTGSDVGNKWLRGTSGNAGKTPKQVADQLRGKSFKNFDEYRSAYWKAVAATPELANQFSARNVLRMSQGNAPFVTGDQAVGKAKTYVLHHRQPIWDNGAVYDSDNIAVVTPRYHQEILNPDYHYNR